MTISSMMKKESFYGEDKLAKTHKIARYHHRTTHHINLIQLESQWQLTGGRKKRERRRGKKNEMSRLKNTL